MPKKVTHADAQLILQLYDLRREAEMRKARNWVATQFSGRRALTTISRWHPRSVPRRTHGCDR